MNSPAFVRGRDSVRQGGSLYAYHAYWAYGLDLNTGLDPVRMKFTGHERDNQGTAGSLDYMHARHYSPIFGKFLSTDTSKADPKGPQRWNRYLYGRDNPVNLVDPNGKLAQAPPTVMNDPVPGPLEIFAVLLQMPSPVPGKTYAQLMGQSVDDLGTFLSRQVPTFRRAPAQTWKPTDINSQMTSSGNKSSQSGGNGSNGWPEPGPVVTTLVLRALNFVPGGMTVVTYAATYGLAMQAFWDSVNNVPKPDSEVSPDQSVKDLVYQLWRDSQYGELVDLVPYTQKLPGADTTTTATKPN